MGAVGYRARTDVRARWRSWLGLVLLIGVFGGAVMTAAAGARRTDSSYSRFLREHDAFDVFIGDFSVFAPVFWDVDFEQLRALPYVEDAAEARFFFAENDPILVVPADASFGHSFNRWKLLEGRAPRAADEVLVPFAWERARELKVGQTVTVPIGSPDPAGPPARELRLRVVGVGAAPGDFPPLELIGRSFVGTPALYRELGDAGFSVPALYLRFARGSGDLALFDADLRRLSGGKVVSAFRQADQAANVHRSIRLQAVALWLIAGVLGLAVALIVGQAIARHASMRAEDQPTLRAVGMTTGQIAQGAMMEAAGAALVGAAVAAVLAWLLSPLLPWAIARVAEPSPGFTLDLTVLAVGLLSLVALAAVAAAVPTWRAGRAGGSGVPHEERVARTSTSVTALTRAGLPATFVAGVRFALEPGRGRSAVPVRSTLLVISTGITALMAALCFGASLDMLLETPRLYGLTWDQAYGFREDADVGANARIAAADPRVEAVAVGTAGVPVDVARRDGAERLLLYGIAVNPIEGLLVPDLVEGRMPRDGEVVLGPRTIARLRARVGDTVSVGVQGARTAPARVSGIAVLPPLSETMQFGEGLLLGYADLAVRGPAIEEVPPPDTVFVRFREGIDVRVPTEEIRRRMPGVDEDFPLPVVSDLLNFGRVRNMPLLLSALLAALSAAALAHVLVTAIRRRRRDLAVLKTLGFVRRQTAAAIAWQASTLAIVATAVGVPLGIAAGRWTWIFFAGRLGVIAVPQVSWLAALLTLPVALVVANLIALWPARAAARTQPAVILRTE